MKATKWSYCETDIPHYTDLLILANALNYAKLRMYSLQSQPYGSAYEDDEAEEMIKQYLEKIEKLHNEYAYMVRGYFAYGRTA